MVPRSSYVDGDVVMRRLRTTAPTPGEVYAEYEQVIQRVERWVESQSPVVAGCENSQVVARIVQRVVQVTNSEFTKVVLNGRSGPLGVAGSFAAGGLRIYGRTGRVAVGLRAWIDNLYGFTTWWLDTLIGLVGGCAEPSPKGASAATILMEAGGGDEDSDARLVRFCREGPIEPLRAENLIVRRRTAPRYPVPSQLNYTFRPFVYLAKRSLSRSAMCALVLTHLQAPWIYLRALLQSPLNVLVGSDVSLLPIVRRLDRARLVSDLVLTMSAFGDQPLWANGIAGRHFKLHMLWYSQNCIPKMYPGDDKRPDLPAMRHMRVDVHWVWTEGFKSYLAELSGPTEIRVVGPILWYLPEATESAAGTDIRVIVFDVIPLPDGQTAFGASRNYYTLALMRKFVTDIVRVCSDVAAETGRGATVLIKHKRPPVASYHDFEYLDFLEALVREKPSVRLLDHRVNLFGLLEGCHLSVSVPYTSTAFLSAAVGTPAIYYDPFAELLPMVEKNPDVYFAAGVERLNEMTRRLLDRPHGSKGGPIAGRGIEAVS